MWPSCPDEADDRSVTAASAQQLRKLGRWIVSSHAKDLYPKSGHFAETAPGSGGMDYAAYLRGVTSLPQEVPFMLEHLRTAEEYDQARQFVTSKAREIQIPLA